MIGVDTSPEMLARARAKVPDGEFHEADLHELPVPDDHVDLVVCALALVHVPALEPVLAELVRILRPGGHLVLSDQRGLIGSLAFPVVKERADGSFGYMPIHVRRTSEYLAAALPLGLEVRRCEEPLRPSPLLAPGGMTLHDGVRLPDHVPGEPPSIWSLHARALDATNAAWRDTPAVVVWDFRLGDSRP